jgi:hypothetical protein
MKIVDSLMFLKYLSPQWFSNSGFFSKINWNWWFFDFENFKELETPVIYKIK